MSKIKSIEKLTKYSIIAAPWEEAISEASQQIRELKKAIKVFEKHRDAGDEWPGFKRTTGTSSKPVPAMEG